MAIGNRQTGFTLVEIAFVLVIVSILLGYTVALFPRQQELKQYRAVEKQMDEIIAAIVGFAQVNGRLPCPALPASLGFEDDGGTDDCTSYGGFVPVGTLGITGSLNQDSLLLDPWGSPYRYYVTYGDFDGSGGDDFVNPGGMRAVGLVDSAPSDDYIDLDGIYLICDAAGTSTDNQCTGATEVFGTYAGGPPVVYGGAPLVLLSMGKNWNETPVGDELENRGGSLTFTDLAIANGPSTEEYFLKDVSAVVAPSAQTTFVRRTTGMADDFDDVVRWVSPNILFSKMIDAGQLP